MENYQDAITEFLKVYYNYPELVRWSASSQLKAADSYIKIGEFSKAKKILKRIISTYGKTSRWGKQAETYLNAI
jgi:TolA-binding protein